MRFALHNAHTYSGDHPKDDGGGRFFPWRGGKRLSVKLTIRIHLVARLKICGVISPLHN
jgi:hypothetical protein